MISQSKVYKLLLVKNRRYLLWFIKLYFSLQLEVSLQLNLRKLIKFCTDRDILRDIIVTAYCPLGCPILWQKQPAYTYTYNVKLKEIADKYNKTPVQVITYLVTWVFESVLVSSIWKNGFYSIKNFNNRVKFIFFSSITLWEDNIFHISFLHPILLAGYE